MQRKSSVVSNAALPFVTRELIKPVGRGETMKKEKIKRFAVKEEQGIAGAAIYIIVDTITGVNYVGAGALGIQSITPLLDKNGNIVIDPVE